MRILVFLLLGFCVAAPAIAGPASERVFSREALAKLAQDQQLVYSHVREGAASQDLQPISNGEIRIELRTAANGASEAFVQMGDVGQLLRIKSRGAPQDFPGSGLEAVRVRARGQDLSVPAHTKIQILNERVAPGVERRVGVRDHPERT